MVKNPNFGQKKQSGILKIELTIQLNDLTSALEAQRSNCMCTELTEELSIQKSENSKLTAQLVEEKLTVAEQNDQISHFQSEMENLQDTENFCETILIKTENDKMINDQLVALKEIIAEKDFEISNQRCENSNLSAQLVAENQTVNSQNAQISHLQSEIENLCETILLKTEKEKSRDDQLAALQAVIAQKDFDAVF